MSNYTFTTRQGGGGGGGGGLTQPQVDTRVQIGIPSRIIPRTNATQNVPPNTAPNTTEFPSADNGDTALVVLSDGRGEIWTRGATDWGTAPTHVLAGAELHRWGIDIL